MLKEKDQTICKGKLINQAAISDHTPEFIEEHIKNPQDIPVLKKLQIKDASIHVDPKYELEEHDFANPPSIFLISPWLLGEA